MTAVAVLEKEQVAQARVEIDATQERLFRLLDHTFGRKGWTVNEDPRFCTEIDCRPIDVIVPVEKQEAALAKLTALQAQISRELDIQVYFILTSPDEDC